ncbi:MAG: hypothetical protein HRU38_24275 [Saccharospirillaceae bacterium]|nr:hypothetical protein [Pseudomonadales bacterium]NRB81739.1 hypothetical protein [Saccharospirillaceae bacterium]
MKCLSFKNWTTRGGIRDDISDELLWYSVEILDQIVRGVRLTNLMPNINERLIFSFMDLVYLLKNNHVR